VSHFEFWDGGLKVCQSDVVEVEVVAGAGALMLAMLAWGVKRRRSNSKRWVAGKSSRWARMSTTSSTMDEFEEGGSDLGASLVSLGDDQDTSGQLGTQFDHELDTNPHMSSETQSESSFGGSSIGGGGGGGAAEPMQAPTVLVLAMRCPEPAQQYLLQELVPLLEDLFADDAPDEHGGAAQPPPRVTMREITPYMDTNRFLTPKPGRGGFGSNGSEGRGGFSKPRPRLLEEMNAAEFSLVVFGFHSGGVRLNVLGPGGNVARALQATRAMGVPRSRVVFIGVGDPAAVPAGEPWPQDFKARLLLNNNNGTQTQGSAKGGEQLRDFAPYMHVRTKHLRVHCPPSSALPLHPPLRPPAPASCVSSCACTVAAGRGCGRAHESVHAGAAVRGLNAPHVVW
jgi:hypothetical protein